MAAMTMLHCTITTSRLMLLLGEPSAGNTMAFFTEFFSRPRTPQRVRYRSALAVLVGARRTERIEAIARPPAFPRGPRELPLR